MSYHLAIEGMDGVRLVRSGMLPRRGDWLNLRLADAALWLPVVEVGHFLAREKRLEVAERGCDFAHEKGECMVFASLALGVRAETRSQDDAYKYVLPPTRWPFGGQDPREEPGQDCSRRGGVGWPWLSGEEGCR